MEYTTRISNYSGTVYSVDDQIVYMPLSREEENQLWREIREAQDTGDWQRANELFEQLPQPHTLAITIRDTDNANPSEEGLIAGRVLTPEDRGKAVAVVRMDDRFAALNLQVGSSVTIEVSSTFSRRSSGGNQQTFEVVGIVAALNTNNLTAQGFNGGNFQIPPDIIEGGSGGLQITLVQVQPEHLNNVLLSLTAIPLVYALDISFFDTILSRLIEQFSALPILVGLLSLGAAAVIMANTVALATLERRRQIGILKAIGLKGNRVLGVMLLENILVSLLGGVLGIGLSALGVYIMTTFGLQDALLIPRDALPVAVILVVAAVAIGTIATLLSASVAVRERVLNVLRYE